MCYLVSGRGRWREDTADETLRRVRQAGKGPGRVDVPEVWPNEGAGIRYPLRPRVHSEGKVYQVGPDERVQSLFSLP